MIDTKNYDSFIWSERVAYILFAVLLFTYAFVSDIEMDLTGIGFGYIDPFFTMGVLWIAAIFTTKATIAKLQRKSYRGLSDEWKGPLTDIKPKKRIGQERHDGHVVVNELCQHPTGGTSKPSVQGFKGIRQLVFPEFYSKIIGGHVIIMSKMHVYGRHDHGNILQHVLNSLTKMKRFLKGHTQVAIGEFPDHKWAIYEEGEWVIKKALKDTVNVVAEASKCRTQNDLIEDAYRLRQELKKRGADLPDDEGD